MAAAQPGRSEVKNLEDRVQEVIRRVVMTLFREDE